MKNPTLAIFEPLNNENEAVDNGRKERQFNFNPSPHNVEYLVRVCLSLSIHNSSKRWSRTKYVGGTEGATQEYLVRGWQQRG